MMHGPRLCMHGRPRSVDRRLPPCSLTGAASRSIYAFAARLLVCNHQSLTSCLSQRLQAGCSGKSIGHSSRATAHVALKPRSSLPDGHVPGQPPCPRTVLSWRSWERVRYLWR